MEILELLWYVISTHTLWLALCMFGVMVFLMVLAFLSHYAGVYDDTDRDLR